MQVRASSCSSDVWCSQWVPPRWRLADGKPVVEFEPPQETWNVPGARAVLKGAATLEGPWGEVPAGGNPAYRFFKVEVVLP